jgi:hypothetical protein
VGSLLCSDLKEELERRIVQKELGKQPVSKARLEAVPWTRLCRECKALRRLTPGISALNHQRELVIAPGLFQLGFGRTQLPQTVNGPQHNFASEPSFCRQLHDNGKGGIFCFPQFC